MKPIIHTVNLWRQILPIKALEFELDSFHYRQPIRCGDTWQLTLFTPTIWPPLSSSAPFSCFCRFWRWVHYLGGRCWKPIYFSATNKQTMYAVAEKYIFLIFMIFRRCPVGRCLANIAIRLTFVTWESQSTSVSFASSCVLGMILHTLKEWRVIRAIVATPTAPQTDTHIKKKYKGEND